MCRIEKIAVYALACLFSCASYSQSAMMPGTAQSTIGGDEVRARDGTSCRQGSYSGPVFDTGISTGTGSTSSGSSLPGMGSTPSSNQTIYARVVIPFGKSPDRLDCTRLYSLEIERLQLELQRLKETGGAAIMVN